MRLSTTLSFPSVGRLEERELELKKEFNSLHQRHNEVREWRRRWRRRLRGRKRYTNDPDRCPRFPLTPADDPQLHGARGEDQDAAVQRHRGVEHGRPSQVGSGVWWSRIPSFSFPFAPARKVSGLRMMSERKSISKK